MLPYLILAGWVDDRTMAVMGGLMFGLFAVCALVVGGAEVYKFFQSLRKDPNEPDNKPGQ